MWPKYPKFPVKSNPARRISLNIEEKPKSDTSSIMYNLGPNYMSTVQFSLLFVEHFFGSSLWTILLYVYIRNKTKNLCGNYNFLKMSISSDLQYLPNPLRTTNHPHNGGIARLLHFFLWKKISVARTIYLPQKQNPLDRMFDCLGLASKINIMRSEAFYI